MKTQVDHTREQQSAAPSLKSAEQGSAGSAQFEDSRPAVIAQRKLRADMAAGPRDENTAQLRKNMQNGGSGSNFPLQRKENRTGLPDGLKSGIESLSGLAMDDVKVHYNSGKPARLQAHAYAQGSDIHVAPGQEKHLPHEAWHVVQQKQGRVRATRQLKGKVGINDDSGLEKEADVMGAKALGAGSKSKGSNSTLDLPHHRNAAPSTAQLKVVQLDFGDELMREVHNFIEYLEEEDAIHKSHWERMMVGAPAQMVEGFYLHVSGNEPRNNSVMAEVLSGELQQKYGDALRDRYQLCQRHRAAMPYGKTFIPGSGQSNRATYISHGQHTPLKGGDEAMFEPPGGVSLAYIVPHGYDAQAALSYPWQTSQRGIDDFFQFSPGPLTGNTWYNYVLTAEENHQGANLEPTAQQIADDHKVTVVIVSGEVRAATMVFDLAGLGYTNISPIHCRGSHGLQNREWAPANYEGLKGEEFKKQQVKDVTANIKGDPGPRPVRDAAIYRFQIQMGELTAENGSFYHMDFWTEVSRDDVQIGFIVYDIARECYYRVSGIAGDDVYLRGIPREDAVLMAYDDDDLEAEPNQQRRFNGLRQRHTILDGLEEGRLETSGYVPYP